MKYAKILRIFSIAIILSLLVVALPATPAQALGILTLSPTEGSIGDTITITGTGFNKSTSTTERYAIIYFSSQEASTIDDIDSDVTIYEVARDGVYLDEEDGAFTTTFTVPDILNDGATNADVTSGTYYLYLCYYYPGTTTIVTLIRAAAEFTVTGGEIIIDPDRGPVDTEVEITGTDFSGNKDITIKYDVSEVVIKAGDTQTSSGGGFTSSILIPDSTAGVHTITVTVSGSGVTANFTVEPDITLEQTSGEAGDTRVVRGDGFATNSQVIIYFNESPMSMPLTTNILGSFLATFIVPELPAGPYFVRATDGINADTAGFTITVPPPPAPAPAPTPTPTPTPSSPPPATAAININLTSGRIGTQLAVSGAGFEAGGTITIKYDDEEVATATANTSGIFVAVFIVPSSKSGDHTITASDGTNTEQLTFTVESTPPPIPAPLLPLMEAKVKSPISFDWEDVTADSPPVTYTLQIATSQDFPAVSIVLEKKALTESEYTVTEEEELKLVGQEAPYYWRIRAVDDAANEGNWTGAGQFYVVPPFTFPSWALYTLIGLGGLFLFGLGYWLGRRTAFYY